MDKWWTASRTRGLQKHERGSNRETLFYPFFITAGLQLLASILVLVFVPRPPAKNNGSISAEADISQEETKLKERFAKTGYVRWMMVLWTARVLDRIGIWPLLV